MEDKLYTAAQVAQRLSLSTETIRRYVRQGKLQSLKVGQQLRITEAQIQEFIKADGDQRTG